VEKQEANINIEGPPIGKDAVAQMLTRVRKTLGKQASTSIASEDDILSSKANRDILFEDLNKSYDKIGRPRLSRRDFDMAVVGKPEEVEVVQQAPVQVPPLLQPAQPSGQPSLTAVTGQQAVTPMAAPQGPNFQQFDSQKEIDQAAKSPVFLANPQAIEAQNGNIIMPTKEAQQDFNQLPADQQRAAIEGGTGGKLARSEDEKKKTLRQKMAESINSVKTYGSDLVKSVKRGLAQGEAVQTAKLTDLATGNAEGIDFDAMAKANKVVRDMGATETELDFAQSDGIWDDISDWMKMVLPVAIESTATLARSGLEEIGVGAATGGAIGSVIPGAGTMAGAATGAMGGVSTAGYNMELYASILDGLEEKGVDVTNPAALKKAFSDKELMSPILSRANKRAAIIGAVDLVGGEMIGHTGRMLKNAEKAGKMSKGMGRLIRAVDRTRGLDEAFTGSAGELAAQVGSGQDVNWQEVGLEGAGGAPMVALQGVLSRAGQGNQPPTQLGGIPTQPVPPNAPFVPETPTQDSEEVAVDDAEWNAFVNNGTIDPLRLGGIVDDVKAGVDMSQMDERYRAIVEAAMPQVNEILVAEKNQKDQAILEGQQRSGFQFVPPTQSLPQEAKSLMQSVAQGKMVSVQPVKDLLEGLYNEYKIFRNQAESTNRTLAQSQIDEGVKDYEGAMDLLGEYISKRDGGTFMQEFAARAGKDEGVMVPGGEFEGPQTETTDETIPIGQRATEPTASVLGETTEATGQTGGGLGTDVSTTQEQGTDQEVLTEPSTITEPTSKEAEDISPAETPLSENKDKMSEGEMPKTPFREKNESGKRFYYLEDLVPEDVEVEVGEPYDVNRDAARGGGVMFSERYVGTKEKVKNPVFPDGTQLYVRINEGVDSNGNKWFGVNNGDLNTIRTKTFEDALIAAKSILAIRLKDSDAVITQQIPRSGEPISFDPNETPLNPAPIPVAADATGGTTADVGTEPVADESGGSEVEGEPVPAEEVAVAPAEEGVVDNPVEDKQAPVEEKYVVTMNRFGEDEFRNEDGTPIFEAGKFNAVSWPKDSEFGIIRIGADYGKVDKDGNYDVWGIDGKVKQKGKAILTTQPSTSTKGENVNTSEQIIGQPYKRDIREEVKPKGFFIDVVDLQDDGNPVRLYRKPEGAKAIKQYPSLELFSHKNPDGTIGISEDKYGYNIISGKTLKEATEKLDTLIERFGGEKGLQEEIERRVGAHKAPIEPTAQTESSQTEIDFEPTTTSSDSPFTAFDPPSESMSREQGRKAINEVNQLGIQNPLNPKEVIVDGVRVEVVPYEGKGIEIQSIESTNKGQGLGTKVLNKIQDIADKNQISVVVYPTQIEATTEDQLRKWYAQNGFVEQENGEMIYSPKKMSKEQMTDIQDRLIRDFREKVRGTSESRKKKYDDLVASGMNSQAAIQKMVDDDNLVVEEYKKTLPKIEPSVIEKESAKNEADFKKMRQETGAKRSDRTWGNNAMGEDMGYQINTDDDAAIFIKPQEEEVDTEDGQETAITGTAIELVYVSPESRGMGKAKALIQKVVSAADKTGTTLHLDIAPQDKSTTTEGLRKLYERFGFSIDKFGHGVRKPNASPKQSPFESFSMKGEAGRKARAALKEAVGAEQFKRLEAIHKNKEKILKGLEERNQIKIECP